MVFGFLIATVGCFRGMQVSGGAESVGKFTTASVVSGIFLIIVADAIFTFIFTSLGI
jgi:phospholipid/cholesterol/gamma-HCH transport system permease protein